MRTLWLFLLVLLWDPTSEAVELNNHVLTHIVTSFQKVSGIEPSEKEKGGGQFSFLMALTAQQCTNPKMKLKFSPSGDKGAPVIDKWSKHFQIKPLANYIAVYSNKQQCSERMLLHQQKQTQGKSPAQLFQNLINDRLGRNKLTVGCVIFYTTYTPCTNRCFGINETCEILPALSQPPFNNYWAQGNIDKYFVFRKVYYHDKDNTAPVSKKLGQVAAAGFQIKRCDRGKLRNPINCIPCDDPGYCL